MRRDAGPRSSVTPNECSAVPHVDPSSQRSPLHPSVQRPHRKRPAHFPTVEVGFQSIIIFLTVCTRQRRSLLANARAARLIIESWQAATFWRVGRYVIMPDHIHLFCAPNSFPAYPLKKWIEYWRNQVTRGWPQRMQVPIWQREYWDRQLRRSESYTQKWQYVSNNPVRHGYVARVEDWPYQGELMCSNGTTRECRKRSSATVFPAPRLAPKLAGAHPSTPNQLNSRSKRL